jgi:nucleotide-binding universal stress UspA family protein
MAVFENVLIPVDDSEQSVRAVEMAASLVQQGFITNITLFNVYNTGDVDITKLRNQERLDELRAESMRILEMHESTLKGQGIDCSIKRAGGDPASLVIDLVENNKEYDLIINRNVAVDEVNKKIYILEPDTQYIREEDGTIRILD